VNERDFFQAKDRMLRSQRICSVFWLCRDQGSFF
jgi:hypothetical protein